MRSFLAVLVGVALWPGVALAQSGQIVEYYHTDALGSVRVVTKVVNNQVQVVERHDFMPFGEEVNAPSPEWLKRLFTGTERDSETGLDHLPFRQLATEQGRFTTPDPLGLAPTIGDGQAYNAYGYGRNNPLRFIDPSGLQQQPIPLPPGSLGSPQNPFQTRNQFTFDPYNFTLSGRDLELFLNSGFIQTGELFPFLMEFQAPPTEQKTTPNAGARAWDWIRRVFACTQRWSAPSMLNLSNSSLVHRLKPVAEALDPVSQISFVGDVAATIVKRSGPTLAGASDWASGWNQFTRRLGIWSSKGVVDRVGSIASVALRPVGAFALFYDLTIAAQCAGGNLQ